MRIHHKSLYVCVCFLLALLVLSALGGGIFHQKGLWVMEWQHRLFSTVCHQNPGRSFWIAARPMAVCSRCFGIYSGFLIGWLLLPLCGFFNSGELTTRIAHHALVITLSLNIADFLGNWAKLWTNTLGSRLLLGWLMGFAAALIFVHQFFNKKTDLKIKNHGKPEFASAKE